jgi:hypothetical protein
MVTVPGDSMPGPLALTLVDDRSQYPIRVMLTVSP